MAGGIGYAIGFGFFGGIVPLLIVTVTGFGLGFVVYLIAYLGASALSYGAVCMEANR